MENLLTVLQGDCVEKLKEIPDGSVQLGVTSPPYDNLRTYGGFTWDFEKTALQLYRVLCDGGILCWNVGDSVVDGSETLTSAKQKIFFREECGFRVHDTMIYEKSNFANPDTTRYHQLFEYVFILSKGKPRCFNPIRDKPNVYAGAMPLGINTKRERNGDKSQRPRRQYSELGMRGNVWKGNTAGQERPCEACAHPAMMPKWLAHDLILSWSNVGDTVIDPLAGSGTTGKEAIELGRKAILIELNPAYLKIINETCNVTLGLALA